MKARHSTATVLSLAEHRHLGYSLKLLSDQLTAACVETINEHGATSREAVELRRAVKAISRQRDHMERRLCADWRCWPDEDRRAVAGDAVLRVYYGPRQLEAPMRRQLDSRVRRLEAADQQQRANEGSDATLDRLFASASAPNGADPVVTKPRKWPRGLTVFDIIKAVAESESGAEAER